MNEKLISLVNYRYEHRAEILKDKLEEEGIECTITYDSVFGQIGGYKVMVMEKDLEEAIKVYQYIRHLYDNHTNDVIEDISE